MAEKNGKAASYVAPSFEETREFGATIDEGWHDASLVRMWDELSKNSGNPQLVGQFVIDNGDCAGQEVREYFPLGHPKQIGEGKLKSLGIKSGFHWKGGIPLDEFAAQFVDFEEPLRVSVQIKHQYSIKTMTGGWKNDVTKEEYDAWGSDRGIRPQIKRYGVAKDEAELQLECTYGDPSQEFEPEEEADEWDGEDYDSELEATPSGDAPF